MHIIHILKIIMASYPLFPQDKTTTRIVEPQMNSHIIEGINKP